MTEKELWDDYNKMMIEEHLTQEKNKEQILSQVKQKVSTEYLQAIIQWLNDEENGIWGDLKITDKPIGEWQDEMSEYNDDYWQTLKGMYINQSCGYAGDDYHGTLEIKLTENEFLRASFSL